MKVMKVMQVMELCKSYMLWSYASYAVTQVTQVMELCKSYKLLSYASYAVTQVIQVMQVIKAMKVIASMERFAFLFLLHFPNIGVKYCIPSNFVNYNIEFSSLQRGCLRQFLMNIMPTMPALWVSPLGLMWQNL